MRSSVFCFRNLFVGFVLAGNAANAATAVFTFEGLQASTGDTGDLTYLQLVDQGLALDITRPGSTFDVKDYPIDNLPVEAGQNGLSPFSDPSSATPFILNFSQPVDSIVLWTGDYGEDTPDIVDLRAFDGANAGGTELASSQVTIPTLDPNAFTPNYDFLAVAPTGGGILSATLLGGTPIFEHSVYYDNIVVEFDPVVEPVPSPSFLFPIVSEDAVFVNTITGGQCGDNITPNTPGCYDGFHDESAGGAFYALDFDVNNTDTMNIVAASAGEVWAIGTGFREFDEDGNVVAATDEIKKCTYSDNCIIIKHDSGFYSEYAEITTLESFSVGDEIDAGQLLGTVVGSANENGGPFPDHLHFQVHYSADSETNLAGTSGSSNEPLANLTLGAVRIADFALEANGNQGRVGFLSSEGDVTNSNDLVVEEGNTSQLGTVNFFEDVVVADSGDGSLIINGPMLYDVSGNDIVVGSGSDVAGELNVVAGANVRAGEIRVGVAEQSNGQLIIDGSNTVVETVGPSSTLVGFAIDVGSQGRIEVRNGATLETPQVIVGVGGELVQDDGFVVGDVINLGGTVSPGSSPGVGYIDGNLRLEAGLLRLEKEGAAIDQLFVTGDIFIGAELQIDWIGDFFGGETVSIFDHLISDYLEDTVAPSIQFEDVISTLSTMRLFTPNAENVGSSVFFDLGGFTTTLTSEYLAPDIAAVPIPASLFFFGTGLLGLGVASRTRRKYRH